MHPGSGDEAPHEPSDAGDATWQESWWFDFVDPSGVRGEVRLAFSRRVGRRRGGRVSIVPDIGLVVVRDDELSLPRRAGSLVVRGDGLWVDLLCETPFEHWTIGMEAFGLLVDDIADDVGERIPVGLDLEWEVREGTTAGVDAADAVDGVPPGYEQAGYEQAGTMRGEVLVRDARLDLDATSHRRHRWGR